MARQSYRYIKGDVDIQQPIRAFTLHSAKNLGLETHGEAVIRIVLSDVLKPQLKGGRIMNDTPISRLRYDMCIFDGMTNKLKAYPSLNRYNPKDISAVKNTIIHEMDGVVAEFKRH